MFGFRFIAVILLLTLISSDVQGQLFRRFSPRNTTQRTTSQRTTSQRTNRYCNNPYCAMCNRIFGLMPGYAYVNGKITYVGRQTRSTPSRPTPSRPQAVESTPQAVVEIMLLLAQLKPTDVLLDPGCGDGRFLTTAAQRYNCLCIGVEIDQKVADIAEKNAKEAGVSNKVLVIRGDAKKNNFSIATVVVLYMFPKDIVDMKVNWPNARMILSYLHEIPGVDNQSFKLSLDGQEHKVFFWSRGVAQ